MGFTVLPRVSGAELGTLVVETVARIRRAYFVQGKSIKGLLKKAGFPGATVPPGGVIIVVIA